jgi:hypothetical protein
MQKELTRIAGLLSGLLVTVLSVAASATTTSANIMNDLRDEAASEGARDLLVRTDEALNALTSTYYRDEGEYWSDSRGVYQVNCSRYTNHLLDDAVPEALDELRDYANSSMPSAADYHSFFKSIPKGGTDGRWRRPEKVSDLRPGDLVVWRYAELSERGTSGHMNIIVGVPVRDSRYSNVWRVRVSDSARSGHTNDNRGSSGSGVGAGEILIKADSSGNPIAYAWSINGGFHTDVSLAMGRPRY